MKYLGYYSYNNGTKPAEPLESNNKKKLAKELRKIVEGGTYIGSTGTWTITNENKRPILRGFYDNRRNK